MTRNETIPATFLWRIEIRVPKAAVRDFEAVLEPRCASVSSFMLDDNGEGGDDDGDNGGDWRVEGFAGAEPDKEALARAFAKTARTHGIETPKAKIQLCIVHMMRNSLNFVAWKDRKMVAADLKRIYQSSTVDEAEAKLDAFCKKWESKFPSIGRIWHRPNLITIFDYPPEIRKVIYTTNAIESLNSVIRKSVRKRKLFPSDTAALKVVYLSAMEASKRWKRPVRDWKNALNQFAIQYDGELNFQS